MKVNHISKKISVILIITLLVSSFNLVTNVSSELNIYPDDGVWTDDFEDYTTISDALNPTGSLSKSEQCNISAGNIKLLDGSDNVTYDYSVKPDNIEAWKHTKGLLVSLEEGLIGSIAKLVKPDILIESKNKDFTKSDYIAIADDDESITFTESELEWILPGPDRTNYPFTHFRIDIDQDKEIVKEVHLFWNFGPFMEEANLQEISMYIWTYEKLFPHWKHIETIEYKEENINQVENDLSTTDAKYIGDDGYLDVLIIGEPDVDGEISKLYTDYIRAEVYVTEGYFSQGYIISKTIQPESLKGWESIIIEGSKPSKNAFIKIQVLYENEEIIEDLDGNSDGFTSHRIDLTSLPISTSKIKIKAILTSEDLSSTPYLDSWTVIWQTKDGFYDSFTSKFRLGENFGVDIERGNISVSESFSDWPIVGKDPQNTRSYSGYESITISNQTYWFTEKDQVIGGGFRGPVVSNGRVFMPSEDNRIYAFNTKISEPESVQEILINSSASYHVYSNVAASDDLVIAATCELASKSNKIYALNSSNLSQFEWSYPETGVEFDSTVCFASAPTIANGRVFATSWNGKFPNIPMISQLYAKINAMLNNLLDESSRLFALDLSSGNPIWEDPVVLPANSYSSPAVYDDMVFVGCDNPEGLSFLVFDENTGEELWNASIGLIGRSSPVIYEDKVFVISREQPMLSLKGNDKVFVFNISSGKELWNITIGENTTSFGNFLRFEYENLIVSSSPISSPAIAENTLFVLHQSGILYAIDTNTGREKWNFDTFLGLGKILPTYFSGSPLVVEDVVYVTTEDGHIYAINAKNGEQIWDITIDSPDYDPDPPYYIYGSPVFADGLIFVSILQKKDLFSSELRKRLFCIGEFKNNTLGRVLSAPIHVQNRKWWNMFNADFVADGENNSINFYLLDKNGEKISGFTNLNGTNNNISNVNNNVIQLCAELNILNDKDPSSHSPILRYWELSWVPEEEAPVFLEDTFTTNDRGKGGWINEELKKCSIEAQDIADGGILSGIDVDSAKYKIGYTPKDKTESQFSDWISAVCNPNTPGVKKTKITAEIDKLDFEIAEIHNITFHVKDQAGNGVTLEPPIEFQMEGEPPASSISNRDEIEDVAFIDEVPILADVEEDPEGSGVDTVTLKYRYSNTSNGEWGEWQTYYERESPFNWYFGKDVETDEIMTSGYYQVVTIAKDTAGNTEELDEDKAVRFLFDMKPPTMNDISKEYISNKLPKLNFVLEDDFELDSLYYRPDSDTEWTLIALIEEDTYTDIWSPAALWDEMDIGDEHYIFFRVTDWCGNEITSNMDNSPMIKKNESLLQFKLDLSDFSEWHWDNNFTIKLQIPEDVTADKVSLFWSYSSDNEDWGDWEHFQDKTEAPYNWNFEACKGSGYYRFKAEIFDSEGLVYETSVESTNVSLIPILPIVLLALIFLILIVITVKILKKMKKPPEE